MFSYSRHRRVSPRDEVLEVACAGLCGFFLGAGLMYLLDPVVGNRRRSLIRGKMTRAVNQSGEAIRDSGKYFSDRARGFYASTRSKLSHEEVSDDTLAERVRSAIGRVVSHPGPIEVYVNEGVVSLCGPVLQSEVENLIQTARGVRGVECVEDRLEVHSTADIPALQ